MSPTIKYVKLKVSIVVVQSNPTLNCILLNMYKSASQKVLCAKISKNKKVLK